MRTYHMIGAGGTGSILFPALFRYLTTYAKGNDEIFHVNVIDGKEISADKLERQLFATQFVGVNKASALIEQYAVDPERATATDAYLSRKNIPLIADGDVVLIAADNFPVRARIERRGKQLDNITVINGGNEMSDGSLQIWVRRGGVDITPLMSQGHPELLRDDKRDPANMTCEAIANIPGGEQTIIANMMSATMMLNALRATHDWESTAHAPFPPGEEAYFDLTAFAVRATTRPEFS